MKISIKSIPVIYYHSIAPRQNTKWFRYWLTLELKYFEDQLKYLKHHNYNSLFLSEYFEIRGNSREKGNYVVLTFDDGYVDNYIYVYPLLKKYGFKGTFFVSPEFVNKKSSMRKTLDDYWHNKASLKEIDNWGFLSWEEMRIMQNNGFIDIQSHTMSHTKYFISDNITGFHYPGSDCLYPIGNLFPERKPYYIGDPDFERLLPYGYPFFEEASAVIAKKVQINEEFIQEIIKRLKKWDFSVPYNFEKLMSQVKEIYLKYKKNDSIIIGKESQKEYEQRVEEELKLSKEMIEKELEKPVEYLCWPHGDNNDFSHKKALEVGYKATTVGKSKATSNDDHRFSRIGLGAYKNSLFLSNLKMRYKINSYRKKQPWYTLFWLYNKMKYGELPY